MFETLKPCPFCGTSEDVALWFARADKEKRTEFYPEQPDASNRRIFTPFIPYLWRVECGLCGAIASECRDKAFRMSDRSLKIADGRQEAIDAWNQRAEPCTEDDHR